MWQAMHGLLSLFAAPDCSERTFFGLPTWFKYLVAAGKMQPDVATGRCEVVRTGPNAFQIQDFSLIGLGILDILLHLAAYVAAGYMIYAGVLYITSQGEPEKAKHALGTIINSAIGLGMTIIAAALVSFIGHKVGTP